MPLALHLIYQVIPMTLTLNLRPLLRQTFANLEVWTHNIPAFSYRNISTKYTNLHKVLASFCSGCNDLD